MYDPIRRTAVFDYGRCIKTHPQIPRLCPDGICYTLCARWLMMLMRQKSPPNDPLSRMNALEVESPALAPHHNVYLSEMKDLQKRREAIRKLLWKFDLATDSIGADNKCASTVERYLPADKAEQSAWRTAPWGSRSTGDMWGVVFDFLTGLPPHSGAILNFGFGNPPSDKEGHALGAYRPAPATGGAGKAVLVFDMNGGEYRIEGNDSWMNWSAKVDEFYQKGAVGGIPSRCEVHVVSSL